jgi:hypothetical protein
VLFQILKIGYICSCHLECIYSKCAGIWKLCHNSLAGLGGPIRTKSSHRRTVYSTWINIQRSLSSRQSFAAVAPSPGSPTSRNALQTRMASSHRPSSQIWTDPSGLSPQLPVIPRSPADIRIRIAPDKPRERFDERLPHHGLLLRLQRLPVAPEPEVLVCCVRDAPRGRDRPVRAPQPLLDAVAVE